ncbi:MAG: RNA polymerase sigma factor [Polyangiaceae bacterium]
MGALRKDAASGKVIEPAVFVASDAELCEAALAGDLQARAKLCERYLQHVTRVLARVLGRDPELADLVHDVLHAALTDLHKLRDASAFRPWITTIAVHHARARIRRRTRFRWLFREELDESRQPARAAPDDALDALDAVYRVLDKLPVDERTAFALRFVDGMELTEVASACEVSLATIKRKLAGAERRFVNLAEREPALETWLLNSRWRDA